MFRIASGCNRFCQLNIHNLSPWQVARICFERRIHSTFNDASASHLVSLIGIEIDRLDCSYDAYHYGSSLGREMVSPLTGHDHHMASKLSVISNTPSNAFQPGFRKQYAPPSPCLNIFLEFDIGMCRNWEMLT